MSLLKSRVAAGVFIIAFVALCWLAFLAVHEWGHVIAAWLTGGSVADVVLHPFKLSMTVLDENPHPAVVGWGGPVAGVAIPLIAVVCARRLWPARAYLFRFFAGFCCVGNGAYLLADAFAQAGDGATLVRAGVPPWKLVLFGAVFIPIGFALWNGQSAAFGLGPRGRAIETREAVVTVLLLIAVILVELAAASR